MMAIDPTSRHISQGSEVILCRQHLGFKAAHLAGGCRLTIDGAPADNLAHYRIEGHPVSIIDILITRKAAENRLT